MGTTLSSNVLGLKEGEEFIAALKEENDYYYIVQDIDGDAVFLAQNGIFKKLHSLEKGECVMSVCRKVAGKEDTWVISTTDPAKIAQEIVGRNLDELIVDQRANQGIPQMNKCVKMIKSLKKDIDAVVWSLIPEVDRTRLDEAVAEFETQLEME